MLGEGTFEAVRLVDGVLFWLDALLAGDGLHTALQLAGCARTWIPTFRQESIGCSPQVP